MTDCHPGELEEYYDMMEMFIQKGNVNCSIITRMQMEARSCPVPGVCSTQSVIGAAFVKYLDVVQKSQTC